MAQRINEFPKTTSTTRRYPWDEWCDGSVWKVRRGEDYPGEDRISAAARPQGATDDFRKRLYTQASRAGMDVRTKKGVDEDGVEFLSFQFYRLEDDDF